jgi:hypothetical protein
MALDLDAVRAAAETRMTPEDVERYCDALWAASLHPLGEPVPAPLEAKADAQIKKNAEDSEARW